MSLCWDQLLLAALTCPRKAWTPAWLGAMELDPLGPGRPDGIKQWASQSGKPGCILALPLIAVQPWTNFQTSLCLSVQTYNMGIPTWVTVFREITCSQHSAQGLAPELLSPCPFPSPCPRVLAGRSVVLAASLKTWFLEELCPGSCSLAHLGTKRTQSGACLP